MDITVRTKTLIIMLVFASSVAAVFAALWLGERNSKEIVRIEEVPVEKIKEVPREVIKEVPVEVVKTVEVPKKVEVVKEVPAKLTEAQQFAISFMAEFIQAPFANDHDEAFYNLDAIAVHVALSDSVKEVVSEDRLRNKFELTLRRQNIRLDEKAPVWGTVTYDGFWDDRRVRLTYTTTVQLRQFVTVIRKGDFRRFMATLWEKGDYGFAGKDVAEKAILDAVEAQAEAFANKFLSAQSRLDQP